MMDCDHGIPTNLRCGACEELYGMTAVAPDNRTAEEKMADLVADQNSRNVFVPGVEDEPASAADVDNVDFGAPRVRLKWFTPDGDNLLAHMARVSNSKAKPDDPAERLIKYLLQNHHWSPFEMVNLCLEVHTERDISAQILRHWSLKFQEFSTRYAEVEDLRWGTECRFQDFKNRQNSYDVDGLNARLAELEAIPGDQTKEEHELLAIKQEMEHTVSYFDAVVNETRVRSLEAYQELLRRGVAKEVARRILPIGLMPTVMYINGNLRSWITYCMERTKPGVQKEHREIALAVEPVLASCFPLVWEAVVAYRAEQAVDAERVQMMKKIEALIKRYDTILIAPMGEGLAWTLNNNKYEWRDLLTYRERSPDG